MAGPKAQIPGKGPDQKGIKAGGEAVPFNKDAEKTKKIEELKETPENKEAVAVSEGKSVETKEEKKVVDKKDSEPAIAKVAKPKKEKNVDAKVELEREYIVPMRKGFMNVPHYRRAKKAVKTLKEFMVRHMNVRDNDTRKIKVDIHLNNEIWFRGIKKPLHKIKVNAKKIDGIVYVTLADPADYVKFKMAREAKALVAAEAGKKDVKPAKVDKVDTATRNSVPSKEGTDVPDSSGKDKDGVDDVKEEAEDKKSGAEKAVKEAKVEAKVVKHSVGGKHAQKTAPVRKVLK
ncbi:50S ribosomal protein L31e [archaeon]|jgi:ribosomal protein L31E|nr:50S ribosomal protein L31e [archaeon]MBT7128791.1 50S ribosomal protein L31e [archaeon]